MFLPMSASAAGEVGAPTTAAGAAEESRRIGQLSGLGPVSAAPPEESWEYAAFPVL